MARSASPHREVTLPARYRRLLWSAERLVPRLRRATWRREWEAELTYAYRRNKEGEAARGRLLARALWSHIDALWVWKEEVTMSRLLIDVRLAIRGLRRTPLFTAVAVATLALGIGANTAIFSVVNGVLLKPLPYPQAEDLVSVSLTAPGLGYDYLPFSEDLFILVRDRARSYEHLAMYHFDSVNLVGTGDAEPERVNAASVTPSYFDVLRTPPAIGRPFVAADSRPGAEPVVLISHGLWQRRYGADPTVVGTIEEMNGQLCRIVGVMPAGFAAPASDTEIWIPYLLDEANPVGASFSNPGIARLAPGASIESASAELATIVLELPTAYPDTYPAALLGQARFAPRISDYKTLMVGDIRQSLWVVLGTVAVVLLIACANVANLFLVRAEVRQREVVLRTALGASRGDVARFFLTESLVLSLAGGLLGLLLAFVGVEAFTGNAPVAIPRVASIGIDTRVLGFTAAAAFLAALLFGSVPILRTRGSDIAAALREGGRSVTGSGAGVHARNALVVAQVALALVLLVGSGLMLRSFAALRTIDAGFDPADVLTVGLTLPSASYADGVRRAAFWEQLAERTNALPGVELAALVDQLPLGDSRSNGSLQIEDFPRADDEMPPLAERKTAGPGFFDAMGIPVLEGRPFGPDDGIQGTPAAIVSRGFAERWWPAASALGKRVRDSESHEWSVIVGVVGDVHFQALEVAAEETVYYPLRTGSVDELLVPGSMNLVIKSAGSASALTAPVRALVRELDPQMPIARVRTMEQLVADSLSRTSFTMAMLGVAASLALLLGSIGIYGVISYVVSQRVAEIGVRIALGATGLAIQWMVVRRGMVLTAIGVAAGLTAALGLSRVLATLLYETSATDPLTYAAVALTVAAIALLASWLPARRASAVDPMVALRGD